MYVYVLFLFITFLFYDVHWRRADGWSIGRAGDRRRHRRASLVAISTQDAIDREERRRAREEALHSAREEDD